MDVVLRPKKPLSRIPTINNVIPTTNWLPFPMDGSKGLPTALSQTWCSDDSISFVQIGGGEEIERELRSW
jgi:hypothetical protein